MAHWRKNFENSDKAIGAHVLEENGKFTTKVVTIERFFNDKITGQMGTENKRFVQLKEFKLPMVCNITNYKRLEKFFNSFDESEYIGKQITLGVELISVAGEKMPSLRFSTRPIQQQKPTKQAIKDEDFPKALASVQSGAITIEKLMETRELTESQIQQLNEIQK